MSGAGAEKRECRPRRTARCRRGCMPGVCASRPGSRTQNGSMHQPPPTAKISSGHERTSGTPLLGCRRLHTTMRRAPPLKPLRQAVDPGAAACRPSPAAAAPATTGGGSAVARRLSCASCTPAKIIGQIPMFRSLPDGKLTKSDPHRFPDGNFYSAAPGMIFDTARKKHSARQHIPPQSAGGDEKRPITLRGNFLTEPLSGQ